MEFEEKLPQLRSDIPERSIRQSKETASGVDMIAPSDLKHDPDIPHANARTSNEIIRSLSGC